MALLAPLFLILIFTAATVYIMKHLMLRERLKSINQPRSYPIIGHGLITKPDAEGFINQVMGMGYLYPDSPRMVLFWLGPVPTLMLYSAQLVEPILTSSKHLNKGFAYDLLEPWLGRSILTSSSERWRPKRKLLTPTFHYDILKDFVPVFNEQARMLVNKLKNLPENIPVDIISLVTLCTLDIICETSMGRCVDAQLKKDNDYVWAVHTINDCIQQRMKNPLMWNDFIYNTFGNGVTHQKCLGMLHSFTRQVIKERKNELDRNGTRLVGRLAFLDLLLEMTSNGLMDPSDIQAEVDTFMFEGHDTTSSGVSWALHLIGCYHDVQKKIQIELDEILGDRDDVSIEDLARLKYLECCLKESLRLCPSVPIIMRKLGCDQRLGEIIVPEGTHILLNQYMVHRDPSQWTDPDRFDPDRFLPENSVGRHPFAFVPFSAGSRNCIGQRFALMEEKVLVAWILRHFNVKSIERRFEVRTKIELIFRPINGLYLMLERRRS